MDTRTRAYSEWLKSLKVGDEVTYASTVFTGIGQVVVTKIAKITPTGMFRLENGELFRSSGEGLGLKHWIFLQPYEAEAKQKHLRQSIVRYLGERVDWNKMSSEDLLKVMEIIKKYEAEG